MLALFLPLLSFCIGFMISEKYGWLVSLAAPLLMLLSTACALYVSAKVWNHEPYVMHWSWFNIGMVPVNAGFLMNNLSALMVSVVSLVSFLVHVYSLGYMAGDNATKRYFAMLGLFTFAMLGIVLSNNLLLIFIFWELVGFSSYMLIGHWQHKPKAAAASKKAFIVNRIGDAGFLIGLMIIWSHTSSFSIATLSEITPDGSWQTIASLCLFCGVIGKSAQFPLLTWLPDAMEGPTPVSALIHAATMVAAGVFLLARVSFLFSENALLIVTLVGIITALMAALAALVQHDIKKVLAYSTISQLGLMVTVAGAGAPEVAILHLFTHAFFKACLFLCAGSIIHVLHQAQHQQRVHFDVQDIRNLGGLRKKLPFTFAAMVISGAALAGLPLSSGFVSKEAIFTALYSWKGDTAHLRWVILGLAFIVSFITVLYIFRLIAKIFLGEERKTQSLTISEPPMIMRAPVALLAFASLWFIVSINPFSTGGWLMAKQSQHDITLTVFSIVWILMAIAVAFLLYRKNRWLTSALLLKSFYLDWLYERTIITPTLAVAGVTEKTDRKIIDGFLHSLAYGQVLFAHIVSWFDRIIIDGTVNGVAYSSRLLGSFTRSFQGGKIQLYIFWSIFAIIIFLIWSLI